MVGERSLEKSSCDIQRNPPKVASTANYPQGRRTANLRQLAEAYASVCLAEPLFVSVDQASRQERAPLAVKVKFSPEIQRSDEVRILRLIFEKVWIVIEKSSAFAGAAFAPDARLSRILAVIEKLLRPRIDPNRKRDDRSSCRRSICFLALSIDPSIPSAP
jgi:hypothetical protein